MRFEVDLFDQTKKYTSTLWPDMSRSQSMSSDVTARRIQHVSGLNMKKTNARVASNRTEISRKIVFSATDLLNCLE